MLLLSLFFKLSISGYVTRDCVVSVSFRVAPVDVGGRMWEGRMNFVIFMGRRSGGCRVMKGGMGGMDILVCVTIQRKRPREILN